MESSVRVGKYIFSVGSDEELAAFVEAANQLKRERVLQKIERQKAAAEIVTAFDQYVADWFAYKTKNYGKSKLTYYRKDND